MPANIVIPASIGQYPTNLLVAAPYDWREPPDMKTQRISASINWGGGEVQSNATVLNFQGSISGFDKIRGMYVDNTQAAADVTVYFPDTSFEFTVNAGEKDFFQVVTNARQVVLNAPMAIATDKTFIQLFNFAPWPLASNKSLLMSVAAGANLSLVGSNTLSIVAAGTNGTLRAFTVNIARVIFGATAGQCALQLIDQHGTGNILWTGSVGGTGAGTPTQVGADELVNLDNINVRFTNGISLVGTATGTAFADGIASATVYFGTP